MQSTTSYAADEAAAKCKYLSRCPGCLTPHVCCHDTTKVRNLTARSACTALQSGFGLQSGAECVGKSTKARHLEPQAAATSAAITALEPAAPRFTACRGNAKVARKELPSKQYRCSNQSIRSPVHCRTDCAHRLVITSQFYNIACLGHPERR